MGFGSFFASLFNKEEDDRKEIRELNLAPEHKARKVDKAGHHSTDTWSKTQTDTRSDSKPGRRSEDLTGRQSGDKTGRSSEVQAGRRSEDLAGRQPGDKTGRDAEVQAGRRSEDLAGRQPEEGSGKRSEEEKAGARSKEKDPYNQAKKELYQYINQIMRQLYKADQEEGWDGIPAIAPPSDTIKGALDRIREELTDDLWLLASPYIEEGNLAAPAELKTAFYAMLLPFYPLYRSNFKEFRYNTFLNREALELFRRLTGRKFRLGYRNRYAKGPNAFEWEGDSYRVYDSKGELLCDGVFEDGKIRDGYAVLPAEAGDDPDWVIRRKGSFKDGLFTDGAVEYIYQKSVGV